MPTSIPHWIDGARREGTGDRTARVTDPATGEVDRHGRPRHAREVDAAVAAATAAFRGWRDTSLTKRTAVLFRFRELLNARKPELAAIITAEHGKVLDDALGEVTRGLEVVEFACGVPHLLKGGFSENASTKSTSTRCASRSASVAVISPFNFPAMVPMWFFPIAIAAGNTVVLKPSEKDPSAALWMAELWKEAGLPDGVFNVAAGRQGRRRRPARAPRRRGGLLRRLDPDRPLRLRDAARAHGKRVQALGGAKNHMVVLPDADLDLAADAAVNAGFGSAGERCMAISALVAVGGVADDLVARIAERIGHAAHRRRHATGCRHGPAGHRGSTATRSPSYVDAGVAAGAKLVVDGRELAAPTAARTASGSAPRCSTTSTPHMSVYTDEIFGPVLSVLRVDTYETRWSW